jgi:hypothetical protein
MAALTADRNTPIRDEDLFYYPIAAAKTLYAGSLVVLDSAGNAEPGTDATGKVAVGRCEEYVDNSSGAAAALSVLVRTGTFKWINSATNTLTKANIGDTVYIVDDQTVDSLSTGSSPAGIMVDIESDGVWVKTEPPVSLVSGLAAANNLSDVGSAATSRTNLGLGTIATQAASAVTITGGDITGITDLAVADGGTGSSTAAAARTALGLTSQIGPLTCADLTGTAVYRQVAQLAGTISSISSVLCGAALATGNATLTCSIDGTPITLGALTITQIGSAEGDIDTVTPSGANVIAVGEVFEVTVGGANTDATAFAEVTYLLTE